MLAPIRRRAAASIPTSSMADIAFLLLIFFLITTVFDEERGLPIVLPEPTTQPVPEANLLHLYVLGQGQIEVQRGSSPLLHLRADQVTSFWRGEVARNPNLIAAVKTHPSAQYGDMVDVLDALQLAGARRVSLQLLER